MTLSAFDPQIPGLSRRGLVLSLGLCLLPARLLAQGLAEDGPVDSAWDGLEMSFGAADAKIEIVLWMNFADPECAWRFDPLAGILFDQHLAAGNIRLIIRDVADGRQALWAALAARAGGPDLYRQMASSLYMGVTDLSMIGEPNDLAAAILQSVEHHGVPRADIMKVMTDRDLAMRLAAAAKTVPEGAMPRAFVNRRDIGQADPETVSKSIDEMLSGAQE